MDFATIIGLIAGTIAVLSAIIIGGESITTFIKADALLIVLGGAVGATLITFSLQDVMNVVPVLKNAFLVSQRAPTEVIQQIIEFANRAKRDGILSLENDIDSIDDEFLQKGLQAAIDSLIDPETLRSIMESEIAYTEERHNLGQDLFKMMNKYCPAFGMIGTLIGLVVMLKNMDDPTAIGPAMAVALITTLYGALFANLIFQPIAAKLKNRSAEEVLYKQIITEGVVSILLGESPRTVEDNLKSFLSPKRRATIAELSEAQD